MSRFASTHVVSPAPGPRPPPPAPFVRQHQTLMLSGAKKEPAPPAPPAAHAPTLQAPAVAYAPTLESPAVSYAPPGASSAAFAPTLAPDGSVMAAPGASAAAFAPTLAPDGSVMAPGIAAPPARSVQPPSSTLPSEAVPPPAYTPPLTSDRGPLTEPQPGSQEERALVDFDVWCKRVAFGIMASMHGGAKEQAALLAHQTGLRVDVVYPAQPPVDLMHAASELQFMKLTLAPFEAYLYSARNPGKPPILHFLSPTEQLPHSGRPTLDVVQMAKRRVTSTPVCRVAVPRDGVGYILVEPRSPTQRVRQEEILQRVFTELVRRYRAKS